MKLWHSYEIFFLFLWNVRHIWKWRKNNKTLCRIYFLLLFSIKTFSTQDAVSCRVFSKYFDNSPVSEMLNKKTFVWSQKNNPKYTRYSCGLAGNTKYCRGTSASCQNIAKPITNHIQGCGDLFFILVSENSYTKCTDFRQTKYVILENFHKKKKKKIHQD